jgi:hypothetical protein
MLGAPDGFHNMSFIVEVSHQIAGWSAPLERRSDPALYDRGTGAPIFEDALRIERQDGNLRCCFTSAN